MKARSMTRKGLWISRYLSRTGFAKPSEQGRALRFTYEALRLTYKLTEYKLAKYFLF